MKHDRLDHAARDMVTSWALGSLSEEERASCEQHLAACAVCRSEGTALRDALGGLETLAPPVAPPPAVGARLMDRIRRTKQDDARPAPAERDRSRHVPGRAAAKGPESEQPVQVWKDWAADEGSSASGFYLLRGGEGTWEPTGVEGVEVRKLFVDVANDRATMLVRMAAGTSYPSHRHANVEECLVLEGVLDVGDLRMKAGDYQRATGGSEHCIQSTETGCLLFIVSSLGDELLPDAAR